MITIDDDKEDLVTTRSTFKPWKPRLITGGKGTSEPPKNWLAEFDRGQWFLCKRKGNAIDVLLFVVEFKFEKAVRLFTNLNGMASIIVDPVEFCKIHELIEILSKEEEQEDGNSIEHQSGGLGDDADATEG